MATLTESRSERLEWSFKWTMSATVTWSVVAAVTSTGSTRTAWALVAAAAALHICATFDPVRRRWDVAAKSVTIAVGVQLLLIAHRAAKAG